MKKKYEQQQHRCIYSNLCLCFITKRKKKPIGLRRASNFFCTYIYFPFSPQQQKMSIRREEKKTLHSRNASVSILRDRNIVKKTLS